MKRLLKKLIADCLFTFNNKLYKQINGCAMGNPLSVILANLFMAKLERDVVDPAKPILYKRYVDDVFLSKRTEEQDTLIMKQNTHKVFRHKVKSN